MYKSITIKQFDEGFLIEDETIGKKYAVTKDGLVRTIKAVLGITDQKLNNKSPVLKVSGTANPKPFTSDSADSTYLIVRPAMTSDIKLERPVVEIKPQSKIEINESTNAQEPVSAFVLTECFVYSGRNQPMNYTESKEFHSGKMHWIISNNEKIQIKRDGYQLTVTLYLKDVKYLSDHKAEAPDIIRAFGHTTMLNKATVLRMFLRQVPFEKINQIKPPEPELAKEVPGEEPKGQEDGCCDDVMFESCANNKPENCKHCVNQSRFEDKKKLNAQKPGVPLLKASMGVI